MAEANFKIDIRWLTLKTCLLPHRWGHVGVKFHEVVITQLLGEIENWFWLKRCGRHKFLLLIREKFCLTSFYKKLLLKNCFLHHFPINRKD